MEEFSKGQRVRIEIEGTVSLTVDNTWLQVHPDGYGPGTDLSLSLKGIKVTLLDPPNWPPQVGDIWEKGGMEYHAEEWRRASLTDVGLVLQPYSHRDDNYAYSDQKSYMRNLDDFKALNPVLVRRRDL